MPPLMLGNLYRTWRKSFVAIGVVRTVYAGLKIVQTLQIKPLPGIFYCDTGLSVHFLRANGYSKVRQ